LPRASSSGLAAMGSGRVGRTYLPVQPATITTTRSPALFMAA